jgi:hypothetical protein
MRRPAKRVDILLVVLVTGALSGLGIGAYRFFSSRRAATASSAKPAPSGRPRAPAAAKNDLRLVPVEAYMRTYLDLFGGLAPLEVQRRARGPEGLFDTWDDYLSALGLPDYRVDAPRKDQTNALMVATFERLGVALCDRAVENDLRAKDPVPVDKRVVFAFDLPQGPLDEAGFAPRFDVLHRTFLGYPAKIAPPQREKRFYELYRGIAAEHAGGGVKSKLTPEESGWAAVCYGLVRHPEFHLY